MMKRLVLSLLISLISMLPFSAMADHPPKRLLKNLMAFSALGKTGKLAEYELNVAMYGTLIYVNVGYLHANEIKAAY
ncbi:hypothetical protein N9X90_08365 [Alphaproteobacteria bacterium]|nr:hypothetical protein [Alphaproteobacteria bacterium]